jgi:hypothetical protein
MIVMTTSRTHRTCIGALCALALLTAACGNGSASTDRTPTTATGPASTAPGPEPVTPSPAPATTVPAPTKPAPTQPAPTVPGPLPGVPVEGPAAGTEVMVFGVRAGDTLRLRARPGVDQPVLRGIAPTERHAVAAGSARRVGTTHWWKVRVHGVTGWSSARYMSRPAGTSDITSEVVRALGGKVPAAETMLDLGMKVANTRASTDPRSRVVVAVRPTVSDLGEITIDVVGIGDDSIAGERLHVFATPMDEAFTLRSVESTQMCYRGGGNGICV